MIAQKWGLGRGELDDFAARSHRLAPAAIEGGAFREEIAPISVTRGDGSELRARD
jgi:acetyl-CoA acetyltransferase